MIANIQWLRFIAAIMVVFYHATPYVSKTYGFDIGYAAIGFAGVDLFFIISGFIMWHTTRAKSGPRDALRFQLQRFGRIFLGYWPFFLLAFVGFVLIEGNSYTEMSLAKSFFLWPQALSDTLLPVSWTLSFELFFYTLFALLLALNLRQQCVVLIWSIIWAVIFTNVIAYQLEFYAQDNYSNSHKLLRFFISPLTIEFFVGCLIGYWVQTRHSRYGPVLLILGIVGMVLVGAYEYRLAPEQSLALGYNSYARVILLIVPCAAIVTGVVFMEKAGVVFFPRTGILLGGASYAIYLLHTIVLHLGPGALLTDHGHIAIGQMIIVLAVAIMATIAISVLCFHYLETPLYTRYKEMVDKYIPRLSSESRRNFV